MTHACSGAMGLHMSKTCSECFHLNGDGWVCLMDVHARISCCIHPAWSTVSYPTLCVTLDGCVSRWLAARNHDIDEAEASLRQHALWRYSYVPNGRISEVLPLMPMVVFEDARVGRRVGLASSSTCS